MLGDVGVQHDAYTTHNQLSITAQTMRLREDFTGFLLDQQTPFQEPHDQRGDLLDLESDALTAQLQGWARHDATIRKLEQRVEVGYFARVDSTSGQQYRIEATTHHPYRNEADLDAILGDVGMYAALDAKLAPWLALRGGVRADLFTYDVIDNCAAHTVAHPSKVNPPGDASCLSQEDFGHYRDPVQRASTAGTGILPRASLVFRVVRRVVAVGQRRRRYLVDRSRVHLARRRDPVRADSLVRRGARVRRRARRRRRDGASPVRLSHARRSRSRLQPNRRAQRAVGRHDAARRLAVRAARREAGSMRTRA